MEAKIAAALLQAQRAAEAVGKTSRNEFAKFNYASSESMIAESRGALHEAGLVVVAGEQTIKDGSLCTFFHVIHESGEQMTFERWLPIVEGKGKPADKAALGAATESLGYFLRDLLLIPRQEVDVSGRDDRKHVPTRKQQKPKQSGNAPAKSGEPAPVSEGVQKAIDWITAAWGDPNALDACAVEIKRLGLEGDDRAKVLAHFSEAKEAAK